MDNKTILITGATSGFGKELTKLIANNNRIIMLGRNKVLLDSLKEELELSNSNTFIDLVVCNYNSYDDVIKASKYINSTYDYIDLIIHNAGALLESNHNSIHPTLMVNFYSPLLVNELLTSTLLKSNNPSIFYTSSLSVPKEINIDKLDRINEFSKIKAYGLSKLAFNLYLIDYFNNNPKIMIKVFDPTIIYTNAVKASLPKGLKWIFPITRIVAKNPLMVASKALEVLNIDDMNDTITYYRLANQHINKNILRNFDKASIVRQYGLEVVKEYL